MFATPIWQSPLTLGADVVVYSATKHIDGQGRCLGGIILSSEAFIAEHIHNFMRQTGPSMSPFNAWVLLKGLETLAVRVRAQTETAAAIADALAQHPKISRLIYPGRSDHPQAATVKKQMRAGSTLVGFEVKGGKAAAFRTLNALKISRISNNLGDAKSLVTHPATTTHQRLTPEARAELGISEGFIRFSAGLEHQRRSDRGSAGGAGDGVRLLTLPWRARVSSRERANASGGGVKVHPKTVTPRRLGICDASAYPPPPGEGRASLTSAGTSARSAGTLTPSLIWPTDLMMSSPSNWAKQA